MKRILLCFLILGCVPIATYACAPGTFGISVQGSSKATPYWVDVYTQNGTYNKTLKVAQNQSQEFCWDQKLGSATVTASTGGINPVCMQFNWPVPDQGSYYKTIYIDGTTNWTNVTCSAHK